MPRGFARALRRTVSKRQSKVPFSESRPTYCVAPSASTKLYITLTPFQRASGSVTPVARKRTPMTATPNSRNARDTSIRAVAQTMGRPASGGTSTTSVRPSIRAHFSGRRQSRPLRGSASAATAATSAAASAIASFFIAA